MKLTHSELERMLLLKLTQQVASEGICEASMASQIEPPNVPLKFITHFFHFATSNFSTLLAQLIVTSTPPNPPLSTVCRLIHTQDFRAQFGWKSRRPRICRPGLQHVRPFWDWSYGRLDPLRHSIHF